MYGNTSDNRTQTSGTNADDWLASVFVPLVRVQFWGMMNAYVRSDAGCCCADLAA
jgi:hypothetical protein